MNLLPTEIIDIIYEYLHELKFLSTLQLIKRVGPSEIEEIPNLLDENSLIFNGPKGFSKRVSEFLFNMAHECGEVRCYNRYSWFG